jgi:C4-dicarboxylate-specific signal transduction histidine kinase
MNTLHTHSIATRNQDGFLSHRNIEKISCGLLHDLINPLTGLMLFLENVLPKRFQNIVGSVHSTNNAIREYIKIIQSALEHDHTLEQISLSNIIEHSMKLLNHKARQHNVALVFIRSRENLAMYTYKIKMYQIILNLLSNAIDAFESIQRTHDRTVSISTIQRKDTISIIISDNGSGIPNNILAHLYRKARTSKHHGTGIGLLHTYEVVTELGGTIKLETSRNRGTTFHISIPLHTTTK